MSDPLARWVERLLALSDGIDRAEAEKFVRELYAAAQSDLDADKAESEFQREE
ncbi:hypothetical protein [Streptomyces sp. HNM0574]|uniref:hypothetical protein n=1 Tax=Streptomyces sp. HNM0574 TaxID=2714954 RepID=UPI00146D7020|nr:hypothetical protein [Streptomyces sp. HNM0574]NLU68337.1 hypothetical protein [Streptomyces sp. HNM0574]